MNNKLPQGNLELETLKTLVENDQIDTVLTVFSDMYGRLIGKRMTGHFFMENYLSDTIHACNYLLACDMEMEPVPGYAAANWELGYGDFQLRPDIKTLRRASWLNKTAILLCDLYEKHGETPIDIAPRTILRNQVRRAADLGMVAMGGSELEFYLFNNSYGEAADKQYMNLQPFSRYIEDYHILQGTKAESVIGRIRYHLEQSGIPVEFSKGEWGPGQYEINLRYADFLEKADRHVLYKHAAKEIAWQEGKAITYMAKWDERHAGSGMHLHVSLWGDGGTKPLFPGLRQIDSIHVSPIFLWFLGGWMTHLREICAFYAPYPNSYKRFVQGSFAPTSIAWGCDNRTASFRIVGHGPSLRIECRIPGADANPYLAFAATLAAGLDGIAQQIEPPPILKGNAYSLHDIPQIPTSLGEALKELRSSKWARETFGDSVVEHYITFFTVEQSKFNSTVTNWERARYFERA